MATQSSYPVTPDGHYFLVRGRLWRCTNPHLAPQERQRHVQALMAGRRAVRAAKKDDDVDAVRAARRQVDDAKHALGERGPAWWQEDGPLCDRRRVENTPYRAWAQALRPSPDRGHAG